MFDSRASRQAPDSLVETMKEVQAILDEGPLFSRGLKAFLDVFDSDPVSFWIAGDAFEAAINNASQESLE